jgi:hypothetical protein
MSTQVGPSLTFRTMEADAEGLERFRQAFAENGSQKNPDVLRWQYLENPFAGMFVNLLVEQGDGGECLAAMHPWMPVPFRVRGESRICSQTVDILTDERYRGQGLFVRLAREGYARWEENPFSFTYGFPNDKLANSYYTKLGWANLDPVPFMVRPLRTGYFLRRLPKVGRAIGAIDIPLPRPGAVALEPFETLEEVREFGAEFTDLWRTFSAGVGVAVDRTAEYLSWRLGKPGEAYRTLAMRGRDRELLGYVTFCLKGKHGGRIGYIMEAMSRPDRPDVAKRLLGTAVRTLAQEGGDAILAFSLEHSPTHPAFRSVGFLPLPERLRPIRIHFGAKPLDEADRSLLADRRSWYISYLDSDTT